MTREQSVHGRGARRLLELAERALERPEGWDESGPIWHGSCDIVTNDNNDAVAVTYGPADWPERDWIAAMCPALARPLADLIRGAYIIAMRHPEYALHGQNAADVAAVILGETT